MTQMAQIFYGSQRSAEGRLLPTGRKNARKAQKVITDDLKSPAALGRRTLATNGTQEIKEIKEILAAHDNLNDILRRISKKKHRLRDGPALTMF